MTVTGSSPTADYGAGPWWENDDHPAYVIVDAIVRRASREHLWEMPLKEIDLEALGFEIAEALRFEKCTHEKRSESGTTCLRCLAWLPPNDGTEADRLSEAMAANPEWQRQMAESEEKLRRGEGGFTTADEIRKLASPNDGSEAGHDG